jgi:hypothetical protein
MLALIVINQHFSFFLLENYYTSLELIVTTHNIQKFKTVILTSLNFLKRVGQMSQTLFSHEILFLYN